MSPSPGVDQQEPRLQDTSTSMQACRKPLCSAACTPGWRAARARPTLSSCRSPHRMPTSGISTTSNTRNCTHMMNHIDSQHGRHYQQTNRRMHVWRWVSRQGKVCGRRNTKVVKATEHPGSEAPPTEKMPAVWRIRREQGFDSGRITSPSDHPSACRNTIVIRVSLFLSGGARIC